jgi:hypothetical protein
MIWAEKMCRRKREGREEGSSFVEYIGVSKLLAASGCQDHERVHQKQRKCTGARRYFSASYQVTTFVSIILRLLSVPPPIHAARLAIFFSVVFWRDHIRSQEALKRHYAFEVLTHSGIDNTYYYS